MSEAFGEQVERTEALGTVLAAECKGGIPHYPGILLQPLRALPTVYEL